MNSIENLINGTPIRQNTVQQVIMDYYNMLRWTRIEPVPFGQILAEYIRLSRPQQVIFNRIMDLSLPRRDLVARLLQRIIDRNTMFSETQLSSLITTVNSLTDSQVSSLLGPQGDIGFQTISGPVGERGAQGDIGFQPIDAL